MSVRDDAGIDGLGHRSGGYRYANLERFGAISDLIRLVIVGLGALVVIGFLSTMVEGSEGVNIALAVFVTVLTGLLWVAIGVAVDVTH